VLLKTGFEIFKATHEMKNRILLKNKGCLFFLLPKIYQLPEYTVHDVCPKNTFSPEFRGEGASAPAPVSYAYGLSNATQLQQVGHKGNELPTACLCRHVAFNVLLGQIAGVDGA